MGSRPSSFKGEEVLFAIVVRSMDVSEYGHYTLQAQESMLNSGARNKAVLGK